MFSNRSLCLILLLLVATSVNAVEGRLFGPEGAPLGGARVLIIGHSGSTVADRDGVFSLDGDIEPPFQLLVTLPDGVALSPVTVEDVPEEGLLEVQLEPIMAEAVTVITGIVPDLQLPPAAAASVIGRGELDQRASSSLTESLSSLPGTDNVGDGRAAVPAVRGLANSRTLLLLDDGRVTAERRAGPSATYLSPSTVEELEVVRGPGAVAYGSDAFGGIIRARSRMHLPGEPTSLRYSLGVATTTGERGATAEWSGDLLGGGAVAGAHYRRFDNYDSPHGEVLDSGSQEMGFRIGYQTLTGGGVLRGGWRTDLGRDIGKPSTGSLEQSVVYPLEDSHRANFSFERPGPGSWSRMLVSLAWDAYRLELEKDRLASTGQTRRLSGSDVDAQDYELRFEAERPMGSGRFLVGVNAYGRFDLHAENRIVEYDLAGRPADEIHDIAIESARKDDVGVFASVDGRAGAFRWGGGLRADRVSTSNDGGYFGNISTSETALSGFVSAGLELSEGVELTGQVARGFRDPLLSDRYYRGFTGRGFITGNPDLKPETSLQYDLALRLGRGANQLSVFGYFYSISDLIERYRDGGDFFFRNQGEAEILGVELEASVALSASISLAVGAQSLRGEVVEDGTAMDNIPPLGGFVVLRGEPRANWWWTFRGAAYARDNRPGPTEQVTPGYATVDIGAGYRVSGALEIQLLGRNLLDKAYLASADEEAVLAPGRTLVLTLRGKV